MSCPLNTLNMLKGGKHRHAHDFSAGGCPSRVSVLGGCVVVPLSSFGGEGWSLDILEGPTWAKGLRFYQAAAAWTMVWQVAGALPVAKVIGLSASCLRNSVTKSRHEGRLAPRRHLGKGA